MLAGNNFVIGLVFLSLCRDKGDRAWKTCLTTEKACTFRSH
uniref:Uncharacterized protein n=1 Tax=Anguilla anguilla TaxID=7936 RepID=A0A0E9QJB6_ANGAN